MSTQSMAYILKQADAAKDFNARVKVLQDYDHPALRSVIKYALDPSLKFLLKKEKPEYKPNSLGDTIPSMLYAEARRLYLFVEGGNDNLLPEKREKLFVQLLQQVGPDDAELLLCVKEKRLPYLSLNKKVIKKAFPGLLT